MSNWATVPQGSTFIHINNMTVNPQTQLPQPLESEIPHPITPPIQSAWPIQSPYAQPIQVPIIQPDPFEEMRKKNQDYQIAKQFQKNFIEVQEKQNLDSAYQAMLLYDPQPIKRSILETNLSLPLLHQSSLWEAASWSITSTGLSMLQALCGLLTCTCAATWGRVLIVCNAAGNWIQPLTIWSLILADSGQGKSTMFGRLQIPFTTFQDCMNKKTNRNLSEEINSLLEASVKKAKKKIQKEIDLSDPHCLEKLAGEMTTLRQTAGYKALSNAWNPATLTVSTITGAGLRKLLSKNGEAAFFASPEPEALSYVVERGCEELLKKGYNQETENYGSAHKEMLITHPSISLLCASQTEIYIEKTSSKKFRHLQGGGFLARILPAVANDDINNSRMREANYLGEGKTLYETRIGELLSQFYTQDAQAKKSQLECDYQAKEMLEVIRQQLLPDQSQGRNYTAWLNKFTGNVARIAGAIHLWEHGIAGLKREVGVESVQMANELMNTLSGHAHYLYSEQGLVAENNALKIQRSLNHVDTILQRQRIMNEGIDTTSLQQRTRIDRLHINNALRILQRANWCVLLDNGSGKLVARFRPEFFGINSFKPIF